MRTVHRTSRLPIRSPMQRLAVLVTVFSLAATVAAAQGKKLNYKVIDLGALPGRSMAYVQPNGLNDRGQVTGWSYNIHFVDDLAFVWDKGVMTAIPGLSGGPQGINERGQVVGPMLAPVNGMWGLHAFVYAAGELVLLPDIEPGVWGWAIDINNRGTVVGFAMKFESDIPGVHYLPLWWEDGAVQQLPALDLWPGQRAAGMTAAVNEAGQIAGNSGGWYAVESDPPTLVPLVHATLWEHGQPLDLGTLEDTDTGSSATDINNAGVVVGSSGTSWILQPGRPFVWTKQSGMAALPMPAGYVSGLPQGINNNGQIVGIISVLEDLYTGNPSENGDGPVAPMNRAVLWQDGQCIDLNAYLPSGSPWALFSGVSVNARGQVLVMAARVNDQGRPYYIIHPLLLDPTN